VTWYGKFLLADGRSPFVGFDWRAAGDGWVDAAPGDPTACRSGIHACRVADLPYWLGEELWSVELDEPRELAHKVVARRARLGTRVEAWTPEAQRELALACVLRTAGHAAAELHDLGDPSAAPLAELAGTSALDDVDLAELRTEALSGADAAEAAGALLAHGLVLLVVDAVDYVDECPVATLAYIAARAAASRSRVTTTGSPGSPGGPAAAERAWQSAWLAARLALTP
jgi:hypothetical protein